MNFHRYYFGKFLAVLLVSASFGTGAAQAAPVRPLTGRPAARKAPARPVAAPACCTPTTTSKTPKAAPTLLASAKLPAAAPAAPQMLEIRGVVLNPDGRPCAGASVYPALAPRQLVVTDEQGHFALPVPAGAAVSLRVDYFGVGSSRVELPTPSPEPLKITLGQ